MKQDQILAIKYKLNLQFYGIDEHVDFHEPLPAQLNKLDAIKSDFELVKKITTLDLWFIKAHEIKNNTTWDPFRESLTKFMERHDWIIAHIHSEKQYTDKTIINYLKLNVCK